MARKRYKPEEIVNLLRQAEVLHGQGMSMADAIRQLGISPKTSRSKFGQSQRTIDRVSSSARGVWVQGEGGFSGTSGAATEMGYPRFAVRFTTRCTAGQSGAKTAHGTTWRSSLRLRPWRPSTSTRLRQLGAIISAGGGVSRARAEDRLGHPRCCGMWRASMRLRDFAATSKIRIAGPWNVVVQTESQTGTLHEGRLGGFERICFQFDDEALT